MAAAGVGPTNARPTSKAKKAYDHLRGLIERGELEPGERILAGQIAAELEISIVPVREAIRRLEAERFVTIEHNVGARVAALDDVAYRHGMEALAIIDGAATALAAGELTFDDLARAEAINAEIVALLEDFDPGRYSALNMAFHEALFGRCPNDRVLELARAEWARFANVRSPSQIVDEPRARETVHEHRHLLDLIARRAPDDEVERAAREHVLATLAWTLRTRTDGTEDR